MNTNHYWTRLVPVCAVCFLGVITVSTPASAQDRIRLRDDRTGRVTEFQALVLTWDASRLVYSANNRESTVAGSRVVSVDYPRSQTQTQAEQQFDAGQFAQAWQSYETAMAEEPREWVKVEMLARKLQCASAMNRQADALRTFFQIQRATPQSRFFYLIPIPWDTARPDGTLMPQYSAWVSGQDEIQALIACSWLLTADPELVTGKLKALAQSEDSRVAHLAGAQLWRMQSISARDTDLQRWKVAVDRMPALFQAGPRFQIAMAQKYMTQSGNEAMRDVALVGLLQIPVLYPEQYQLAGSALNEAYQILSSAGRSREANLVLSELKRDFASSTAALSLGTRIEKLDQ